MEMLSSLVRKWAQKQKEEWEEMSEGGVSGSLGHREVESEEPLQAPLPGGSTSAAAAQGHGLLPAWAVAAPSQRSR